MPKTVGLIGGIAPGSTIEYYRQIIAGYRAGQPDGSYPQILLNSIDLVRMLDLAALDDPAALIGYLGEEIDKLARAGADFAALAANTPHVVFDQLRLRSSVPLVSIVEATRDAAQSMGLRRLGLMGTSFTMGGRFYPEAFATAGLEIVLPTPAEQAYVHDRYMGELVKGSFLPSTRAGMLAIAERLRTQEGIDGLILAGTELPLLLPDDPGRKLQFLDTTAIHVEQIVARLLE